MPQLPGVLPAVGAESQLTAEIASVREEIKAVAEKKKVVEQQAAAELDGGGKQQYLHEKERQLHEKEMRLLKKEEQLLKLMLLRERAQQGGGPPPRLLHGAAFAPNPNPRLRKVMRAFGLSFFDVLSSRRLDFSHSGVPRRYVNSGASKRTG